MIVDVCWWLVSMSSDDLLIMFDVLGWLLMIVLCFIVDALLMILDDCWLLLINIDSHLFYRTPPAGGAPPPTPFGPRRLLEAEVVSRKAKLSIWVSRPAFVGFDSRHALGTFSARSRQVPGSARGARRVWRFRAAKGRPYRRFFDLRFRLHMQNPDQIPSKMHPKEPKTIKNTAQIPQKSIKKASPGHPSKSLKV